LGTTVPGAEVGVAVAVADHVDAVLAAGRHLVAAVGARAADLAHPLGAAEGAELHQEGVAVARQRPTPARQRPRPEVDGAVEAAGQDGVGLRVDVAVERLIRAGAAEAPDPAHPPALAVAGGEDVGAACAGQAVAGVERAGSVEPARDHRPPERVDADPVGVVGGGAATADGPVEGRRPLRDGRRHGQHAEQEDTCRDEAGRREGHVHRNTRAVPGLRPRGERQLPPAIRYVTA
jgi:hypothetical protein